MIAQKLKAGLPVEPQLYHSATVSFTDICGFTRLCTQSSPLQIITLLNTLFVDFDAIITSNDSYKVRQFHRFYQLDFRWKRSATATCA